MRRCACAQLPYPVALHAAGPLKPCKTHIRFSLQTSPGVYDERGLKALDYVLETARKYGLQVRSRRLWGCVPGAACTVRMLRPAAITGFSCSGEAAALAAALAPSSQSPAHAPPNVSQTCPR